MKVSLMFMDKTEGIIPEATNLYMEHTNNIHIYISDKHGEYVFRLDDIKRIEVD